MNKKGFTLVELLAVIIILALLAVLTGTSVTKMLKDTKEDLYESQLLSIKAAAQSWGADNLYKLPDAGECAYITLSDLQGYGLLDDEIVDPRTNKVMTKDETDSFYIKITTTSTTYGSLTTEYEVNPSSISGCTDIYPDA